MQKDKNTAFIKSKAAELGFDFCGISKAEFLENEAKLLETWLKRNYNGKMAYMANYFDKRLDPRLLVDGAKSVITFILNYFPEKELTEQDYKISKYAYGTDYHFVIKDKLSSLLASMQTEIGNINARVFVDSAPVMDKVWAKKGGLGWIGKHSNLINRKIGSFFFIGEIICDLELDYDGPIKDYCGTCTACIDACPTDAITEPYVVDGSKCISYLTIELKENIPTEFKGKMENWAFGCDICQDVCPWNSFAKPHKTAEFLPNDDLKNLNNWEEITHEVFSKVFKKSAIKRTKYEGLMRNIDFLKNKA
ncbi:tRNA epoxyqueuosine(34) reductase QueG [Lacihabitans soyangensis]|uniref:Epoxyqueuosine reductase n=1 Tax=Lacihabitans soyangensis TaxID=869394 RepID=A0AAE3KW59_9BACT|nr:tRNA epoxyqueuosine(34) reductase QueG [Lacihabitans soyangensis]MCP9765096.1 tRNA epoxyqueuosine(34) reductase QueG [Lacihabitans soyangensis]